MEVLEFMKAKVSEEFYGENPDINFYRAVLTLTHFDLCLLYDSANNVVRISTTSNLHDGEIALPKSKDHEWKELMEHIKTLIDFHNI